MQKIFHADTHFHSVYYCIKTNKLSLVYDLRINILKKPVSYKGLKKLRKSMHDMKLNMQYGIMALCSTIVLLLASYNTYIIHITTYIIMWNWDWICIMALAMHIIINQIYINK